MPEDIIQIYKADIKDLQKKSKQIADNLDKIEKKGKKTTKSMKKGFIDVDKQLNKFATRLAGAFVIQQAVSKSIAILKDFEKELSTLQSITGQSKDSMGFFAAEAIKTGISLNISSREVVKAFTLIGSARPELLKDKDALAEVTKQSLILAKAAGIDTVQAANALANSMNQFGAATEDAAMFTDILATSQQKGSSFIVDTAEAMKNAGAASKAAGLSFQDTNVAIQAMAAGGIKGAEAGTKLRGVFSILASQSNDELNPSIVGLEQSIVNLAAEDLNLAEATKIFGRENATAALTLADQVDVIKRLNGQLNEQGNAMAQAVVNMDNLQGDTEKAGVAMENFILSLNGGSGAISNFLRFVVQDVTAMLELFTATEKQSDAMADQQLALNVLVGQITAANVAEEERLTLIEELNKEFPDFLKNLDKENVTNEELVKTLKDVNDQLIDRIIIQQEQEKLDEKAEDISELRRKAGEEQLALERKIAEVIRVRRFEEVLLLEGNEERVGLIKKLSGGTVDLTGFLKSLQSAERDVAEAEGERNELLTEREALMKTLGITQEDLTETTEEAVVVTEDLTEKEVVLANTIESLKKQQAELRKEQDKLVIGSAELAKNKADLAAITEKITIAQGKETEGMKKAREAQEKLAEKQKKTASERLADIFAQANAEVDFQKAAILRSKTLLEQETIFFKEQVKEAGLAGIKREDLLTQQLKALEALEQEHIDRVAEIKEDQAEKDKEVADKTLEEEKQRNEERLEAARVIASSLADLFTDLSRNRTEKELSAIDKTERAQLDSIEKQLQAEIISSEEANIAKATLTESFQAKRAAILTKQAKKDKAAALFRATIDGVAAVIKAGIVTPLGIATAIANAAQIAAIAARQIPEFHEGEVDIRPGKKNKKGEFQATLMERESVIRPEATMKYRPELMAANNMTLDKYIDQHYVAPAIQEALHQVEEAKSQGLAENIAGSLNLIASMDKMDMMRMKNSNSKTSKTNSSDIVRGITEANKDLARSMELKERRHL